MKNKIYLLLLVMSNFLFGKEIMYFELEKPIKENLIIINLKPLGKQNISEDYKFHRVKKGDYLKKIADENKKKTINLIKINELKNPNLIYPKQKIYLNKKKALDMKNIPAFHVVKAGENIIEIASFYELDYNYLIKINELKDFTIYPNQRLKLKE